MQEIAITQTKKPSNWQLKNVWGIGHRQVSIKLRSNYLDWIKQISGQEHLHHTEI